MHYQRKVSFGALVVAILLASASTAYACVTMAGKVTVETTRTDRADGDTIIGDLSHGYCSGHEPNTAPEGGNTDEVTVTVAPSSVSGCVGALDDDTASIDNKIYVKQTGDAQGAPYSLVSGEWVFNDGTGCFRDLSASAEQADISVANGGNGTATFDLSGLNMSNTNGTSDAAVLCVGYSGSQEGILAPLRVVAI